MGAENRSVRALALGAALALLAARPPASAPAAPLPAPLLAPPPATAFVGVTVLTMEEDLPLRDQTVVVEGERITRLGPRAQVRPPAGAVVVDGRGKYLLPGFVDAHVHVETPNDFALYLAHGVTTVRNMRGRPQHLLWKAELATGARLGPVLYTTGPFTNEPQITSAADAERAVEAHVEAGYDYVKVHGPLGDEAFRALVAAGRRHGVPVVGHPPSNLFLETTLEVGLQTWEHAEDFAYVLFRPRGTADSTLRQAARAVAASKIPVTPTLVVYDRVVGMVGDLDSTASEVIDQIRYVPPARRSRWTRETNPYTARFPPSAAAGMARQAETMRTMTGLLAREGVPLLVGTDAGDFPTLVPGFSFHEELLALARAGLSPLQVLRAATRHGALGLGHADEFGTVRVGKRADLVLLDADPLADLAHTRRPAGVMTRGRWLPRAELDRMLAAVAAEYARAP